ncbi:uncharacterized protein LOC110461409 [Mizuhopecten yessoensis]|uniref:Cubilin n=1 Tax=Mizuhopecten yessoensis TaxID=6573 RepID=A0A210Q0F9_MIZYE|nr:uncharacterized protein LOC110461409 [Mizuhopecten yessoensis]XP_021370526.1 uncharacterized protein LOC110461409 [Mizuhopecten yessoensis]XP_021370527.1 uncharacterized protein LOC110461409 [Mizuhopecten yessoensis]XP_021370528.1 uncharacterized protein LOC110461409 [Mizuhopecten yessoensis]OWF42216.1 Cubilin [Mizuhopecten yessoensis]
MTTRRYALSLVIGALVQVVRVSCQCDNSPFVIPVPLYDTASITSPGYPRNYAINLNCSWIFEFEHETDYFFVRMDDVYVDCKGDVIRLINLHTNTDIVSFCDDATTSDVYTQSGRLRVEFSTNGVQRDNDRGFRLYVTSMPSVKLDVADCPSKGDVELLAGKNTEVLTSPHFPKHYPSSQTCHWKIPSKTGYKIVITVDFIDIEYGSTPPEDPVDYLQIDYAEGNSTTQNQRYSGRWNFQSVQNYAITSVGDVEMTFTSDADTSYAGFLLRYKLVELPLSHTNTVNPASTSNGKVITTERTRVTSEESVFTTEDTVSTLEEILSTSQETIVTTADTVSTSKDILSTSQETTVTTADTVSTSKDILSTSQETIVTTADTVSTSENILSTSQETIVTAADTVSTSDKTISASGDTISASEDTISTSENILPASQEHIVTTEGIIYTTNILLSTPKGNIVTTDNTISTSDDIGSKDIESGHTTKGTISIAGDTTNNDTNREEIVIPRYVYESKVERRTSSCDVQTCVIPLVVAIGLLLSILFVVIVALGVTRSRRKDRYHVRKAFPCRPPMTDTANGDSYL